MVLHVEVHTFQIHPEDPNDYTLQRTVVIRYLLTQKLHKFLAVFMHLNLVKKCVEKKIESCFTHRRQCLGWGERGELIRAYTQQIRVCSLRLGRGPCSLLHACACTHAL